MRLIISKKHCLAKGHVVQFSYSVEQSKACILDKTLIGTWMSRLCQKV